MKSTLNKILIFVVTLVIALLAIVANSDAQEEFTFQEGDVCVGFISSGYTFTGVNLSYSNNLVALAEQAFDLTIDPVTGDVYLALWAENFGYTIENFNGEVIFSSDAAYYGFDSLNGELVFTEIKYPEWETQSLITMTYSYSASSENESPEAFTSTYGWPALGPEGILFHNSDETIYNRQVLPDVKGFYPFAFSPDGESILSIENLTTIWLYDVFGQTSTDITPFESDTIFITSADWHPEGIMFSTYDTEIDKAVLWLYQPEMGRLLPLMETDNNPMWYAQVLPCDYLLEQ